MLRIPLPRNRRMPISCRASDVPLRAKLSCRFTLTFSRAAPITQRGRTRSRLGQCISLASRYVSFSMGFEEETWHEREARRIPPAKICETRHL
jgi:hypothetical protein